MAVPVLNFNPYNPWDTAVSTALGTYKGMGEGRNAQLQAQTAQKKLPFVESEIQSMINLHNAQAQQAQQEANFKKAIYEAINSGDIFGDGAGGPAPRPAPGGMPSGVQNPGLQAGQIPPQPSISGNQPMGGSNAPMPQPQPAGFPVSGYTGPSNRTSMIRKFAGFPEVTPQEQYDIAIAQHYQQAMLDKRIEQNNPTGTTLTRHQRLSEISPSIPGSVLDLIENYDEAPGSPFFTALGESFGFKYPSQFKKKVANASEGLALAKNFGTDAYGLHKAEEILTPAPGESKSDYAGRMYQMMSDALPSIQESYREKGMEVPQEFYDNLYKVRDASIPKPSGKNKVQHSIDDPKVIYTAQKHGISPEQVIGIFNQ